MVYGDALGFLNENIDTPTHILKGFLYRYENKDIIIQKQRGQYSYITELIIAMIKSLVDDGPKLEVIVDYPRFYEELKVWTYYRHGAPSHILYKLRNSKGYYDSEVYWKEQKAYGISRIFPILMANKNYAAAEKETYKNIIYLNRHPQVILTGLLLIRGAYVLLEKGFLPKEELIQELKDYIIHMQFSELNRNIKMKLPTNYAVQFEKERILYLLDLDRYKKSELPEVSSWDSKIMFFNSLNNFYRLQEGEQVELKNLPRHDYKEMIAISYGLWGINTKESYGNLKTLKDEDFINDMANYLCRLRDYQLKRPFYNRQEKSIDLFQLEKGDITKHPILNVIKIKDRVESPNYLQLVVETKAGLYTFIKDKAGQ